MSRDMALVPATLQTALATIFNAMNNMTEGGDNYCAAQIASAIKAYILTGQVSTADSGAAPAGAYAGSGTGIMTIDNSILAKNLLSTFTAGYSNDELASHIAADIDNACKADNIVTITSTGTVTTPAGSVSPFSGPGQGTFTGVKSAIETVLKACFTAMNDMPSGGNDYFATQLASAVTSYLTAGIINIILNPPFVSGAGVGAIA